MSRHLSEPRTRAKESPARRHSWLRVFTASLLLFVSHVCGAGELADELAKADALKGTKNAEFAEILTAVDAQDGALTRSEHYYLAYLQNWQKAYEGKYGEAIAGLDELIRESDDPVLRLRARATMVNVLSIAARYKDAFSHLTLMLEAVPDITDNDAREQAIGVAALLYNQVGQFKLGREYAEQLIAENWQGRGTCKGGQLRIEALYKSGQLQSLDDELQATIDDCVASGEILRANLVRTYMARFLIDQGRLEEAFALLSSHYEEVETTHYAVLISEFDALRAHISLQRGDSQAAAKFAKSAIAKSVPDQYTEPLVTAYRVLYELARQRGDTAAALDYHEKYAAADKGYLDDISARQLAFEKVKHETLANQLQIDALNKQNQVLKLERENNRLYIALLLMGLGFIAYWAYRMKISQVHFRNLSQTDGLTGISNRHHFIERASRMLDAGRRSNQELCVVLCDLDHFKAINDKYGHAAGDIVLKRTVAVCQSQLRQQDLFGRFGGEEFAIILDGCRADVARQRCEQFRQAIAALAGDEFGIDARVSASFGVASTTTSGYELRMLLAHADVALYQAKRAGRNRVVAYDAKHTPPAESAAPEERIAGVG